jgi:LL-diaminopimelate aminotransferase
VAEWYGQRFGVRLDADKEVMSLIGSKEGIAHVFWALVDPGDYTLVPDPAYPVYRVSTILSGGTPYLMPLKKERNFLPDLKAIPEEIARKAKILFLNYPNNPTAAVAPREFYEEAVAFAKKNNLLICSDLAYSEIAYEGYRPMSLLEIPGAKDFCLEFHSFSKTFNMTGWRIGMAVGSAEAISALSIIKTNVDSGVFKAIQETAAFALRQPTDFTTKMCQLYQRRRDILVEGLNKLGWKLEKPKATFYLWVPVSEGFTSADFTRLLLEKCGIVVVPGNGYGPTGEGYVRFSITTDEKRIVETLDRMEKEKIFFS